MPGPLRSLFAAPFLRRLGFHAGRISGQMDRHFFTSLLTAVTAFDVVAAIAVTMLEDEKRTLGGFGSSFYWAVTTVIGSGDPSYVNTLGGFAIGWLLAFFGVAIVAAMTGAVVGFVIDSCSRRARAWAPRATVITSLSPRHRRRRRGRGREPRRAPPTGAPARVVAGLDAVARLTSQEQRPERIIRGGSRREPSPRVRSIEWLRRLFSPGAGSASREPF